jgi:hypothetical protein
VDDTDREALNRLRASMRGVSDAFLALGAALLEAGKALDALTLPAGEEDAA